jgi:hypothetical protein
VAVKEMWPVLLWLKREYSQYLWLWRGCGNYSRGCGGVGPLQLRLWRDVAVTAAAVEVVEPVQL